MWGNVTHKYGWGGEVQGGSPASSTDITYSYTGNRRNGFSYDAAGNLTSDIGQNFTYDVTGQQTASSYTNLQNSYDGNGLRVKRTEDGLPQTYYLRSSVLGGQVVAEIVWTGSIWQWNRGYVYLGSQLLAVQQGGVNWMHEDPVTKSKRVTNSSGAIVSTIELDPWGADTNRSSNAAFQPKKFTSYERDGNGSDEAMFRRYNRWHSRFDQPDPYDGSYDLGNPQSFNRYAYVNGDPVNFADPTGLDKSGINPDPEGKAIGPPPSTVIVLIPGNNSPIGLPPGIGFLPPGGTYVPGGIGGTPGGPGGGDKGDRPPTSPEGKGNPNCIMNAVSGATGLARPFGNVGPTGSIGHDGIHVVAPSGSQVTTLSPLAGTVLGIHDGGDGTKIVDVQLDRGGFVALYKDLVTVNVRRGQHLGGGATVGTVGAYEGGGLHFALLNGGRDADKYYRSLTSTGPTKKIVVGMFTNPNGPNSPVNCPGVAVNNAGVNPHP